jgi:hypothetical protein
MSTTTRRWEIDALRGLMLVLMTLTHLPTRLADPLGQPFGYVSAAEGFVLLSAYMAGLVYARRQRREGGEVMQRAFLQRAWKIYCCQAALLLFLFSVVAAIGVVWHQTAVTDMLSFYFDKPLTAFFSGLLLVYNPPLLDILPLYVLFMALSPLLLLHGTSRGWVVILGISLALWLLSQFGFGGWLYESFATSTGVKVPLHETGSFSLLAWQFLWVLGLWMGAREATGEPVAGRFPTWMVRTAVVLALLGLIGRHTLGQFPFAQWPDLMLLFDKWGLRPMRLLNLLALVVVTMHFGPGWVKRLKHLRLLETLGAASLPVFCAHLVATLLALAIAGAVTPDRPVRVDVAILGGSFAALYAVARISAAMDRRVSRRRERWGQQRLVVRPP